RVRIPPGRAGTSNRKRVLRGGGQLPPRGVDSQTKCRVIEPRNRALGGGPPSWFDAGAMSNPLTIGPPPRIRSRRGRRAGRMVARVPRELGRSWQFLEGHRLGSNRSSKLRDDPSAPRLRPNGDERQSLRGIAKRRQ